MEVSLYVICKMYTCHITQFLNSSNALYCNALMCLVHSVKLVPSVWPVLWSICGQLWRAVCHFAYNQHNPFDLRPGAIMNSCILSGMGGEQAIGLHIGFGSKFVLCFY